MRHYRVVTIFALGLAASGCYHATVDTGRAPSAQVVEKEWAHGFVYGLVPPSTVETAAQCPNGVAKVETQLSFLNQLATFLTGGLYTPMRVTVQCAAAGSTAEAMDAASDPASALHSAMVRSAEIGAPVYVQF